MATKKSEEKAEAETATPKKTAKEREAAKSKDAAYMEAQHAKVATRLESLGLKSAPGAEGVSIQVRTVPGPRGEPRLGEGGGGMVFHPEAKEIALAGLTYEQFHSIVSNPLLEVLIEDEKAVRAFKDFRPS